MIVKNSHHKPSLDTRVKCGASREGHGAVLEQLTPHGWETSAYASRFLNNAEKLYSIKELELFGVVWSIEDFKHYLYGKKFPLVTDHRVLLSILREKTFKIHQS